MLQGTRVHHEHTTLETGSLTWHVQDFTTGELGLVASRGLGQHLALEAILPVRAVSATIDFLDAQRRPLDLPGGSIHHRDETLLRPADPWLLLHGARSQGAVTLALRAGISLPLGRTEENPFELGRRGLPHQHLQFGTGTWDPLLGIGIRRRVGRLNWSLTGLARFVVGENARGHRAGHRYAASLQADPAAVASLAPARGRGLPARTLGDLGRAPRGRGQPRTYGRAAGRGHREIVARG